MAPAALEEVTLDGIPMLACATRDVASRAVLAFTSRAGGKSEGPYRGLNLSFDVGDAPGAVRSNRESVAGALGIPTERWTLARQVHGTRIERVGVLEVGRGGRDHLSALPRTDALVTAVPGVAVGVLTADCMPILMVSLGPPAAAAVHAGWRGAVRGIAAAAVRAMLDIGCQAGELVAFMGPRIGPCCFEVAPEVACSFKNAYGGAVVDGRNGRFFVDIAAACREQLLASGVPEERIVDSRACTCCGEQYFSHRRSGGVTGRQTAIVALPNGY